MMIYWLWLYPVKAIADYVNPASYYFYKKQYQCLINKNIKNILIDEIEHEQKKTKLINQLK